VGYRSNVVIALTKEAYLDAALINSKLPQILKEEQYEINELGMYWLFRQNKWYESYPEVAEVMNFLETLDMDAYAFLRVGETSGDIEEQGSPIDFDISYFTVIETPFS
jgi:hypothetical protein